MLEFTVRPGQTFKRRLLQDDNGYDGDGFLDDDGAEGSEGSKTSNAFLGIIGIIVLSCVGLAVVVVVIGAVIAGVMVLKKRKAKKAAVDSAQYVLMQNDSPDILDA